MMPSTQMVKYFNAYNKCPFSITLLEKSSHFTKKADIWLPQIRSVVSTSSKTYSWSSVEPRINLTEIWTLLGKTQL